MNLFSICFSVIFFFFMSSVSFAKESVNIDIKMLTPDFSFSTTSKYKDSDNYYLQILYTENSQSAALNKIELIQKSIQYPMAMQPYKRGFRVYVGPIKGGDIASALKSLLSIGYDEHLVRHINNQPDFLTYKDILFKKIGRIGDNNIILPFNKNGSLARFSSLDIDSICKSINSNVALLSEYGEILSTSNFISDIGAQNRYWLTSKETVTRVSDNLVIKAVDNDARYPIICLINHSKHK
ncbi:hypothetical protein SKA34_04545 [Photobacterium sp. SKA34]|uniref:hypothetical protein n=1 Tax=Photobacterium sp. SKA34 TaxID=121723 RepID=UPI00006BDCDB|nr:hypothetical protein [Photobacterium sp. SKA34]EAR53708.1 hypothetical protein SKA34_04545 [Photobacterium sp. SKA34]